jgi:hypothetical protein
LISQSRGLGDVYKRQPAIKVRRDIGCFMMISFTVVMSISTGDRKISVTQKWKEWTVMNRAAFSHFMS